MPQNLQIVYLDFEILKYMPAVSQFLTLRHNMTQRFYTSQRFFLLNNF